MASAKFLDFMSKFKSETKILDVGSYPGNMIKLSNDLFKDKLSEYACIGLSYDDKFIEGVKDFNVKCINSEIDPSFPSAKEVRDWGIKNYDLAYLLDTIVLFKSITIFLYYLILSLYFIYNSDF